jgi:calcium/calmodulin-dependent protein kinase I
MRVHANSAIKNLLVVDKPPEKDWWVKISDFGISKRSTDGQLEYSTVNIGTQEYMAPEVRFFKRRHKDDKAAYTVAADMWALGELCVRLITGNAAFDLRELVEYYHYQQAFVPDDVLASHGISQDGRDFIRAIMAPDPQHRLSAEDAAKHRWITLNHRPSPAMYGPV